MTAFFYRPVPNPDSADVEAFPSYFAVLARQHGVSRARLEEALWRWSGQGKNTGSRGVSNASLMLQTMHSDSLQRFVDVVARATGNEDVHRTTLLPLRQVACAGTRRVRAWCVYCWDEDARRGVAPYDRLYWYVRSVSHCRHHHVPLRSECPICRRQQVSMHHKGLSTSCYFCNGSLKSSGDEARPNRRDATFSSFIGNMLDDLIRWRIEIVPMASLHRFMRERLILRQGSRRSLPAAVPRSFAHAIYGIVGGYRIELDSLLLVLAGLQATFRDVTEVKDGVQQQLDLGWVFDAFIDAGGPASRAKKRDIRAHLTHLIDAEADVPHIGDLARELDVHLLYLNKHFPRLCQQLHAVHLRLRRRPPQTEGERQTIFKAAKAGYADRGPTLIPTVPRDTFIATCEFARDTAPERVLLQ